MMLFTVFLFTSAALLLPGCGHKGPLYLPEQESTAPEFEEQAPRPTSQDESQEDKNGG